MKYYCHRLPDVVDREEFNTLLKTFTKIDPDSDSVFNNQLIWDILATKKPLDTIDIVPSGLGVTDQSSAKGPTNLEIFLGINTLEDINNFSRKDLRARQDRLIEGLLACLLAIFPQNKHDQIKDEHVKCFFVDSSYPRFHQALINLQCDRSILDRIQNEYNRLNSCITGSSKLSIEQTLSQEFKSKQGILHNVNLRKAEQRILIRRYELPFNNLLATLKIKTDELIRKGTQGSHEYNAKYDEVKIAAETLNQELKQAKDHFFNNITPENFEDFKNTCTLAIDKAEIEFVKQRGWHGIHFVLKGILAVLAALTIIPALIVVAKSQHGLLHECKRSFFSTPMTDSAEKLQLLKNSLLDDKDGIFQMIQVSVSG